VTSQEPRNPPSDPDIPDTEVIVVSAASPVFVDSTGRRRRLLRRLSYAFGGICIVYGGLVSVALAGGPVSPSTVLPLPDLGNDDGEQAEVRASPAPQPTSTKLITEALQPRAAPIRRPVEKRNIAPRPAPVKPAPVRTPAPKPPTKRAPTPTPSVAPTRPVESTVTPSPSVSVPPVPTTPPVVKGNPPLPPAPAPPAIATEEPKEADTSFDPDSADTDSESPEPEGPA
jgi:hypothetical protein